MKEKLKARLRAVLPDVLAVVQFVHHANERWRSDHRDDEGNHYSNDERYHLTVLLFVVGARGGTPHRAPLRAFLVPADGE
mgnify:CR=1 FL=1